MTQHEWDAGTVGLEKLSLALSSVLALKLICHFEVCCSISGSISLCTNFVLALPRDRSEHERGIDGR